MAAHQQQLIARVRQLCHDDGRLDAALMYGSFAQGSGDEHSDIEFWLFFAESQRHRVDPAAWCAAVAPLRYLTLNEFGTHVAFFPGLLRGEFHFAGTGDIAGVRSWPARGADVSDMLVLDRTGALREALARRAPHSEVPYRAEEVERLCGRFANWLVLAYHVTRRGESLRALEALSHAHRHLLWLVRLGEDATAHWLTPSRLAEAELPPEALAAVRACLPGTDPAELPAELQATWACGRRYWLRLAAAYGFGVPDELFADLDAGW